MKRDGQQDVDVAVLYEKISHLDDKLSESIEEQKQARRDHVKERAEDRAVTESIKIEIASLKGKAAVLAVVGSAVVSGAVSLLFKLFTGGTH